MAQCLSQSMRYLRLLLSLNKVKGWQINKAFLIGLCGILSCACASDNIHQPEPDLTPAPQFFSGSITSSIPIFDFFVPITSDNTALFSYTDETLSKASIELGIFFVDIKEINMSFEIGPMEIENVECTLDSDGNVLLSCEEFECMAGKYLTSGSLEGSIIDGVLDFTIKYKPGSMPFEVKSQFSGK